MFLQVLDLLSKLCQLDGRSLHLSDNSPEGTSARCLYVPLASFRTGLWRCHSSGMRPRQTGWGRMGRVWAVHAPYQAGIVRSEWRRREKIIVQLVEAAILWATTRHSPRPRDEQARGPSPVAKHWCTTRCGRAGGSAPQVRSGLCRRGCLSRPRRERTLILICARAPPGRAPGLRGRAAAGSRRWPAPLALLTVHRAARGAARPA